MKLLGLNFSWRAQSAEILDASGKNTGAVGSIEVRENVPGLESREVTAEELDRKSVV